MIFNITEEDFMKYRMLIFILLAHLLLSTIPISGIAGHSSDLWEANYGGILIEITADVVDKNTFKADTCIYKLIVDGKSVDEQTGQLRMINNRDYTLRWKIDSKNIRVFIRQTAFGTTLKLEIDGKEVGLIQKY